MILEKIEPSILNGLGYIVRLEKKNGNRPREVENDPDIADKITATNFKQVQTGELCIEIESDPVINSPKPNDFRFAYFDTVEEALV